MRRWFVPILSVFWELKLVLELILFIVFFGLFIAYTVTEWVILWVIPCIILLFLTFRGHPLPFFRIYAFRLNFSIVLLLALYSPLSVILGIILRIILGVILGILQFFFVLFGQLLPFSEISAFCCIFLFALLSALFSPLYVGIADPLLLFWRWRTFSID